MSPSRDDIDLLHLLERSLGFFRRYRWLFIGALALGLLAGFLFYKSIAKTYESKMLVHTNLLTNQEQIAVVNGWNQLLNRGEHEALSSKLNLPPATLGRVKKIRAEEIQQVFTPVNPHGFTILAVVTDTAVLDELQEGILYGFDNSPHVREKLQYNRQALQDLIVKTQNEIAELDSLKDSFGKIVSGRGQASSSLIIDGAGISKQIIELEEKLIGLKRDLQFTNAVTLLQGFPRFSQPSDPNLLPLLVIGTLLFLAIAYVLAIFHSISRKLERRRGAT